MEEKWLNEVLIGVELNRNECSEQLNLGSHTQEANQPQVRRSSSSNSAEERAKQRRENNRKVHNVSSELCLISDHN